MLPLLGPRATAIEEWEQNVRQVAQYGEQIVQLLTKIDLLYGVNGLAATIAQAEAGAIVAGGQYTKEQALAIIAMLSSFEAWLSTPLAPGLPTPKQIMFTR